jgi:hypothetical protein
MTKAKVVIGYHADDGYQTEAEYRAPNRNLPRVTPKAAMLAALEELARLTALFGWEDEALEKFTAARERVAKFKEARAEREEPVRYCPDCGDADCNGECGGDEMMGASG